MRVFCWLAVLAILSPLAFAQDSSEVATKDEVAEIKGQVDGINETLLEMKSTLDALKKLKISGYIQAQFQNAEASGVSTFSVPT
jgi:hypothetical protein